MEQPRVEWVDRSAGPSSDAAGALPSTAGMTDSPLIMIPEDSAKPHVLCISPHGGVQAEAKMDLLHASSVSDDEDMPDDCERGALKRCMQRLKLEKTKTKFLQIQLAKSQDVQQKKDIELSSISKSLQRQQAVFAQQCNTVRKREETIQKLQKALVQKDTQMLGMELEKVWESNVLASTEHAEALQVISNRLASIETPQKQVGVARPEPHAQMGGTQLSPLFHESVFRSPADHHAAAEGDEGEVEEVHASHAARDGIEATVDAAPSGHHGEDMHVGDDGACSEEGDENAVVNTESASQLRTLSSIPGREALGVLHDVENVLGQGDIPSSASKVGMQRGPATEPTQQDAENQQTVSSADNTCELHEIQTELDRVNARAEAVDGDLTQARERIQELQEQCTQLHTELDVTRSDTAADVQRLQAEVAVLKKKLGKKEQLAEAEYQELQKSFYLLDGVSDDTPVSQKSSLPSPRIGEGVPQRADSPDVLQRSTLCSPGLWESGPAALDPQPTVDDVPEVLASHGAPQSTQQVDASSKLAAVASSLSQLSPSLTHTAPRLHASGAVAASVHAASVGSANECSEADAVIMQEALQGRLRAATAEPDTLSESKAEQCTLRDFVHRIQEHLSCGNLEELEAKVQRMSACDTAPAVCEAVETHTAACSGADLRSEPSRDTAVELTEKGVSDRYDARVAVQQDAEQLALKAALEEERIGRASERALQSKAMHELREQLQQAELRLQGLAEVQEMTAAELVEARAERDGGYAANYEPPQPRASLIDQGMCTDAQVCERTIDQGTCTDAQSMPPTAAAVAAAEGPQVLSVLHVADPPPLQWPIRLSPSKAGSLAPAFLEAASVSGSQPVTHKLTVRQEEGVVHVRTDLQPAAAEQSYTAAKTTEVFEERLVVMCKEHDAAVQRVAQLEGGAEELQRRCTVLKLRAENSESDSRALQEGWPAVKQEVEELTEKCRQAESQVTMYKTLNSQLQHHLDDLRRHAPKSSASTDAAASSEQRLQRIEAAVTRSDAPRSDTLLQLLHIASDGQVAARAAADVAESELRSVRGALREAESQVAVATKHAEELAEQLQDEQRKSKDLREQSRRLVRQVQGQLQHPLSHRHASASHHSDMASLRSSPRHWSFMAPPTPFDGAHTARCPAGGSISTDSMHGPCMQRCESAPPPHAHSCCPHGGSAGYSTNSSQACDTDMSHHHKHQQHQQHDSQDAQAGLHPETVGRARLTVHVPRGRLAAHDRVAKDACRRSTSLPPTRGDTHPGDSSPLCNAMSALKAGENFATESAIGVDPRRQQQHEASVEDNCMGCQALQFRLGKLEEQLDSAECHASAATAAQADLTERESALVQELQEQLSVRETLQAQLGNVELDLHTTSQQRDLAIEQLSQFVAGPAAASFDACANGAYMYPQNTVVDSDQGSPESATIRSDQARNRALQELQSLSAEAHKEAQRLKRELEVSEACIASLRADVARADKEAAEATLERNQATQNAVRAECDLAAAQLRLSAVQQQEVDGDSLKRRFADSAECVKDLDSQLDAVRREVAQANTDRDGALAHNRELTGRMKELASRDEESRTARETISADLASLRVQLAESSAEASRVWDECTDLRRRLSNTEECMHTEREKALEASRTASRLQGELRDARRDTDAARENTAEAERRARGAEARLRDAEDAAAAARQDADTARERAAQRLRDSESSARNVQEGSLGALEAAKQRAEDAARLLRVAEEAKEAATAQCDPLRERAEAAECAQRAAQQATSDAEESAKAATTERDALQQRVEAAEAAQKPAEAAQKAAEADATAARTSAREAEERLQAATSATRSAEGAAASEKEKTAPALRTANQADERARVAEAAASDLRKELAAAHDEVASAHAATQAAESRTAAAIAAAAATAAASTPAATSLNGGPTAASCRLNTREAAAPCAECVLLRTSLQEREAEVRALKQKQDSKIDVASARSSETLQLREQLATAECDVLALRAEVRKAQEQATSAEKDARDSSDAAVKAGRDAQAAAKQAADVRAEALAAESEAGIQRAAADAATVRERQLQDSTKRLTADVEKWRAAAQATQDRLRSSSVAAGAADGDARDAKDALQELHTELASLRRKERSARVEVAQLRAKLTALDDFAGDQFEASLCATPSRNTCGMSMHGDESSVAGDGGPCTDVDSHAGDAEHTPVNHSMVPYRSVPLQRRPAACDRGLGERHLISAQPSEDACSHRGALVVAAGSTRRRGGGRGDGEKLLGVSLPVLRCLHRALHGLCAAMPEVYAASMYWTGMDSRRSRLTPADEQAQLQYIIGPAGDLLETSEAEAAIAGMSSNNQVCLKAAVAVGRLRRHSQTLAARLQSTDLRVAQLLNYQGRVRDGTVSDADARHGARPGSSCSGVVSGGAPPAGTAQGWRRDAGTFSGHAWEGMGSCSPRVWNMQARRGYQGGKSHQQWDGDLALAVDGAQGDDVDDTVSDFLGSIASQAKL